MVKISKNCNLGDMVRIVFDDHSEGEQHIVFEVFGRVLRKDRRSIVLASWKYADSAEVDENICQWTILRAGIRSIDILESKQCQPQLKTQTTSQPAPANSASGVAAKEKPENVDTIPPK
jgi:hypothetical protein